MRKSRLLSLLLASFVILSAVFSPISYATEAATTTAETISCTFSYDYITSTSDTLSDDFIGGGYGATSVNSGDDFSFYFTVPYRAYSSSGSNTYPVLIFSTPVMASKGNSFGFTVSNVNILLEVLKGNSYVYEKYIKMSDFVSNTIKVIYSDGTYDLVKNYELVADGNMLTFSYSGDSARADVTSIEFNAFYNIGEVFNTYGSSATYFLTVSSDSCLITHSGSLSGESQIDGIIEWLKSIFQSIKEIPEKIGAWIQNVINTIKELPDKILEGIKNLFIPSEEAMQEFKDNFDLLMQDRFGALYQAASIISDFADNFSYKGTNYFLEFPSVTINLAGTKFTFGGWNNVSMVPSKFGQIITALRGIVGIVATFAFINTLRNKFNRVIGDNS